MVPLAVYREIEVGKNRDVYTDLQQLNWVTIQPLANPAARSYLFDLDDGEAEALVLAKEQNADFVIIDEKLGRRYAGQLGVAVTGTVGVLLGAKEQRLIGEIAPLLYELQKRQSWISENLIRTALKLAGE
jgi:predicted nucleic acid-binding protein